MSQADEEKIYHVNLEELVEKYVWKRFKDDTGFPKKLFLRRSNYYMDIRWGYVAFKHETTSNERPSVPGLKNKDVQLYFSEYENKTAETQTYTFSTSRQTTATTKVELQENYTIGAETNLEINFGEVLKVGGGINGSMSITETNGQEFSKTLTWEINTEIKVPSWNKAKASLHVYEKPQIIDFEVKTTMSLNPPSRTLPVTIRKQGDGEEVKTYWITNLRCLFDKRYIEGNDPKVKLEAKRIGDTDRAEVVAILTTRGVCQNMAWQNQQVQVECNQLPGAPAKKSNQRSKSRSPSEEDGE